MHVSRETIFPPHIDGLEATVSWDLRSTPLRLPWAKAGAAIGKQVFTPIQDSFADTFRGQQGVFPIGSAFTIVGGLVPWFLIPDMSREVEMEDVRFQRYLEKNGYEISHTEKYWW
ncbi:hypothetical protein VTN77DRAFT_5750 [Rasamsonia byssochlamydoides]|uniref:uncharacterized protein n=1 Tax=Rasamsonia byssochlamydoides TaxID=89139 RepID=UPI003744A2D5